MAEVATKPDGRQAADGWLRKDTAEPAERMPVLAEAMAAVATAWTDSFCALSASEGEVVFKGLRTTRVDASPSRRDSLPIVAALRVPSWQVMAGLSLDRGLVSIVVQALFGGGEDEQVAADRPVSPVEMRIVDVIGGQAAAALTAGFGSVVPTRFEFDRTLAKPDCAFLGKRAAPLLAASFALTTLGQTVALEVLLPQDALDARAATWAGTGKAPVLDAAGWTRQLRSEVSRATMRLEAEMALAPMTLGALARLKPGQVLELPQAAAASVLLRCGEESLFRCELGQSAGFYTVRVGQGIDPQPSRKDR